MKAVLLSIQPKWCELIANGKKTVEVRKTKPKLETPFKVYIYCTQDNKNTFFPPLTQKLLNESPRDFVIDRRGNGKVIGEFVCGGITEFSFDEKYDNLTLVNMSWKSCLLKDEIADYANGQYIIFGWHISDLVIYDKPKELSEFCKPTLPTFLRYEDDVIKRPPQSWCYVEELQASGL